MPLLQSTIACACGAERREEDHTEVPMLPDTMECPRCGHECDYFELRCPRCGECIRCP